MEPTDAALFDNWLRKRDADAFKALASRYATMVYATCRRILGNPTEAEDVTQECFVILATTRKAVGGYLAPWLHRVAYNRSLARLRSERRRRDREVRFAAEREAMGNVPWEKLEECVDEAIAGLPEKLRVPIVACYLDGKSHETIAGALGIPRSTVTGRIEQGVERLRRSLKSKGIAVVASSLTAWFESAQAETAPPAVHASLGKLALSGATHVAVSSSMGGMPVVGFWTAKTAVAATAALMLLIAAGVGLYGKHREIPSPSTPKSQYAAVSATPAASAEAAQQRDSETANAAPEHSPVSAPPMPAAVARVDERTLVDRTISLMSDVSDIVSSTWNNIRDTLSGEKANRMECQMHLKQLGLIFKMFANDSQGQDFPMLSSTPGRLMFSNRVAGMAPLYPDYFDKAYGFLKEREAKSGVKVSEGSERLLLCPSDTQSAERLQHGGESLLDGSGSYYYLGYAVVTIDDLKAFAGAYEQRIAQGLPFDTDLDVPGGKVFRLREGVENNFISDPDNPAASAMYQSKIPVLIEAPHHNPKGGNVLYMDGHVEFRRFSPDNFPMDQETMDILATLSGMK